MATQIQIAKIQQPKSPLYYYDQIRSIHLEITHRCNAACPMCARNLSGGRVNPDMPLVELSLADIKTILKPDFIRQLEQIYACGNYGDPMVARDCLEIFEYLRSCNEDLNLCMHTNGSARRPRWWQELAKVMQSGPHYMRFGIDGLADTNHLYRRGADWKTVMRSAEAFIQAGGFAEWDFLVFKHNEHQVEAARKLSEDMGFKNFYVRKTGRFVRPGELETSDQFPVENRSGKFEYFLELPVSEQFKNPALAELGELRSQHGNYDNYLDEVKIKCKVAGKKRKMYLSAEGLALPCCWLGATFSEVKNKDRRQFLEMINANGGKQALNARHHGLESVVNGPLFQQEIPESWHKSDVANGKLAICARTCGVEFDPLGKQRS